MCISVVFHFSINIVENNPGRILPVSQSTAHRMGKKRIQIIFILAKFLTQTQQRILPPTEPHRLHYVFLLLNSKLSPNFVSSCRPLNKAVNRTQRVGIEVSSDGNSIMQHQRMQLQCQIMTIPLARRHSRYVHKCLLCCPRNYFFIIA